MLIYVRKLRFLAHFFLAFPALATFFNTLSDYKLITDLNNKNLGKDI